MISKRIILPFCALLNINSVFAIALDTATKELHNSVLTLSDGTSLHYRANIVNGTLVAENDILLGAVNKESTILSSKGSASSLTSSTWNDGIIPYQFANDLTDSSLILTAKEAIAHWNNHSSIRLVERNSGNSNIYQDYLEITEGQGCASYVGRIRGKQEIWFSKNCSAGSMIHEIGHAIGLLHEHTRTDRDQYIAVNANKIISGKEHNFDIPATTTASDLGPYDYGSIMHYGAYFFSNDGNPTISPINDITGVDLGQRVALSEGDISAVDLLYGTDLSLSVTAPDDPKQGDLVEIDLFVTNEGGQGANSILITLPLGSGNTLREFTGSDWSCEQQAIQIVCARPIIIEGTATLLSVTVDMGFEPPTEILASLSAKTWDPDVSNNGLIIDDTNSADLNLPELGSASNSESTSSLESSGAGSIYLFQLLVLMLLTVRQRIISSFSLR